MARIVRTLLYKGGTSVSVATHRVAQTRGLQSIDRAAPAATSAAATTLLKTMVDPATPASVRVRATDSIFNHAAKAIEIEDIETRVAALEQAVSSGKGSP